MQNYFVSQDQYPSLDCTFAIVVQVGLPEVLAAVGSFLRRLGALVMFVLSIVNPMKYMPKKDKKHVYPSNHTYYHGNHRRKYQASYMEWFLEMFRSGKITLSTV